MTGESPVPELSLNAVHVEGDPVKVQALVQPGSDLGGGLLTMRKSALFAVLYQILYQTDIAQGQGQLKVEEVSEVGLVEMTNLL